MLLRLLQASTAIISISIGRITKFKHPRLQASGVRVPQAADFINPPPPAALPASGCRMPAGGDPGRGAGRSVPAGGDAAGGRPGRGAPPRPAGRGGPRVGAYVHACVSPLFIAAPCGDCPWPVQMPRHHHHHHHRHHSLSPIMTPHPLHLPTHPHPPPGVWRRDDARLQV